MSKLSKESFFNLVEIMVDKEEINSFHGFVVEVILKHVNSCLSLLSSFHFDRLPNYLTGILPKLNVPQNILIVVYRMLKGNYASLGLYEAYYRDHNELLLCYTDIAEDPSLTESYIENGKDARAFTVVTAEYWLRTQEADNKICEVLKAVGKTSFDNLECE